MPLTPPDFDEWFKADSGTDLDDDQYFTVGQDSGWLFLPTGHVVASEPGLDASPFLQTVSPGRYPVNLLLVQWRESASPDAELFDEQVAAARIVIRDEPVLAWELAVCAGQDVGILGDDQFFGYPVDGGSGWFTDAESLETLMADDDLEWLIDLAMDVSDRPTSPTMLVDEDAIPIAVAFTTGDGDGHYPTWIGRTVNGDIACYVSDFLILHRLSFRPAPARQRGTKISRS